MSTRSSTRMARRRLRLVGSDPIKEIDEPALEVPEETLKAYACRVAVQKKLGAYISTPEQRVKKEQPDFLAGYAKVSELEKDVREVYQDFGEFIDYGEFWSRLLMQGIEKPDPESMPHREVEDD